ncbi:hypothetical protein NDU88_005296 [Pleurodeles waltl]|uniref:Uncharacterized protein n=1 Tax=Pleurodeles waltl TaxID=8319 RepID=A0AAV7MAK4_PLEWA|nr:hypothetical protein NDU88_005296 [Pleurodeles waltl]
MGQPRPNKSTSDTMATTDNDSLDPLSQTEQFRRLETTLRSNSAKFEKILHAILDTKTSLETKIDTVSLEVNLLRADHRKLAERVTQAEAITQTLPPTFQSLQTQIASMQKELNALHRRAEDADGRSRQNNIRFIGFPERSELPHAELFLEKCLRSTVFHNGAPTLAHRIPGDLPKLVPLHALS